MQREIPPPLALTLLILMRRQGWEQKELAAALGVSPPAVSLWLRKGKGLDRKRLEQAVRTLGLDLEEIDRTLRYLTDDPQAETPPGFEKLTPGERREVEEAHAQALRVTEEKVEDGLCDAALKERTRRAQAEADACWKGLQAVPPEMRTFLIDRVQAYRTPAFCARICAESREAASQSTTRALALAKLALYVAERVPGEVSLRCRAYAWAFIANALRVWGKLPKANTAFARAHALWNAGTVGDPALSEARFLDLEASLRRDQRQFERAFQLLDRALELANAGETGNILLKKEHVQHECGRYEEAIATLREAEPCIDSEREPRSWFALHFNLASNYCELGRFEDASRLLRTVHKLGRHLDRALDLLKIRWLDALVTAGLGEEEKAIEALEDLRKEFETRKAFDSILVSLDLAEIYLKQSRWLEVRLIAEEMAQAFQSLGVHREASAALALFQEAVQREEATVDLVRRLARYLCQSRRDPAYRFQDDSGPELRRPSPEI